jgi:hypothetical protein
MICPCPGKPLSYCDVSCCMCLIVSHQIAHADEVDDIQKQIDDLQNQMELSVKSDHSQKARYKLNNQLGGIQ